MSTQPIPEALLGFSISDSHDKETLANGVRTVPGHPAPKRLVFKQYSTTVWNQSILNHFGKWVWVLAICCIFCIHIWFLDKSHKEPAQTGCSCCFYRSKSSQVILMEREDVYSGLISVSVTVECQQSVWKENHVLVTLTCRLIKIVFSHEAFIGWKNLKAISLKKKQKKKKQCLLYSGLFLECYLIRVNS